MGSWELLTITRELRENAGVPEWINDFITEAERRHLSAREDVQRAGESVLSRVQIAQRNANAGLNLNESGEIQSAGTHFDQMCTRYQITAERIKQMEYLARQYFVNECGVPIADQTIAVTTILTLDVPPEDER